MDYDNLENTTKQERDAERERLRIELIEIRSRLKDNMIERAVLKELKKWKN